MKKHIPKQAILHANRCFMVYHAILAVFFVVFLALSIWCKACGFIGCLDEYENIIGVTLQSIIAIAAMIVSITSIAITLQNDEYFGVKISNLYALRVTKHHSVSAIIAITCILCVANVAFYTLKLFLAVIDTGIVTIAFLGFVMIEELPIIAKNETAMLRILKINLISCHATQAELPKDLKSAIKYLLWTKTFSEVYGHFRDPSDEDFNHYLLPKLLELQRDLAAELKDNYSERNQYIIGNCLLNNIVDSIKPNPSMPNDTLETIQQNRHFLTSTLFQLCGVPSCQEQFLEKTGDLFLSLSHTKDSKRADLLTDIIIVLAAGTVQNKDFKVLEAIQQQLSVYQYYLLQNNAALNVFVVLSMYLYYLCCSDATVPRDIKESIAHFVNQGNVVRNNILLQSWKSFFSFIADEFNVDFQQFFTLTQKHVDAMEYYIYSSDGKFVVLTEFYLVQWYLSHLLNTETYNFEEKIAHLIEAYPQIHPYLKSFADNCLDRDGNFAPTDEMRQIVGFYDDKDSADYFSNFQLYEQDTHAFKNLINNLRYIELQNYADRAANVDTSELARTIKQHIEKEIRQEWGFDPTLAIENNVRYLSVFFEQSPEAVNFQEAAIHYCTNSVLLDLRKSIPKTVLYYDDAEFESRIASILQKNPKYLTGNAKRALPNLHIKNEELKKQYTDTCSHMTEFQSKLLWPSAIVLDYGFRFNCEVLKVELRPLTDDELFTRVTSYQRADGQFVFRGVFMSQEQITEILRDKYRVLTLLIRHQICSSEDTVFEFRPPSKAEN